MTDCPRLLRMEKFLGTQDLECSNWGSSGQTGMSLSTLFQPHWPLFFSHKYTERSCLRGFAFAVNSTWSIRSATFSIRRVLTRCPRRVRSAMLNAKCQEQTENSNHALDRDEIKFFYSSLPSSVSKSLWISNFYSLQLWKAHLPEALAGLSQYLTSLILIITWKKTMY